MNADAAGNLPGSTVGAAAIASDRLTRYGIDQRPGDEKRTELGQDAFLTLMLTQLKHQDPLAPMENGEFLGQMAQFSTVSGIEKMQGSIENLAGAYGTSQTLQASELVGREVLVESRELHVDALGSGVLDGRFELDAASGDVAVEIIDERGSPVQSLPLGQRAAGTHDFSWDGRDAEGAPVAPGTYTASVTAASGDERVALNVLVARTVDSVEFAPGGAVALNTGGGRSITLADIRQINDRRSD